MMLSLFSLNVDAAVEIIKAQGWFESGYVTWKPLQNASGYNVFYKASGASDWTKVDNELVRNYGSYGRADMVGLSAGTYQFMVVPIIDGSEKKDEAAESGLFTAVAYDRAGFAHQGVSNGVGAYKNDGTLKDGARVVYIYANNAKTVKDALVEEVAVIGENLTIRRFEKVEASNGCVVSYTHGGGRIGVIIEAETDVVNDEIKAALTNVAMQIAALYPKYVSEDEVSEEFIAHEKEVLKAQIMNDPNESQKPEKVIEGMIQGRIKKELKEICLLDQVYVKAEDGKQTVGKYVEQVGKEQGAALSVKRFVRFETGEGIEKKNEDFAAEVVAQLGQ